MYINVAEKSVHDESLEIYFLHFFHRNKKHIVHDDVVRCMNKLQETSCVNYKKTNYT